MNNEIDFNSLIEEKNNQMVTTSLNVHNVFGKKHKDVLKIINKLRAQNCALQNMFYKGTYESNKHHYGMYYMNRDGFTFLVMGFTGSKANEFKLKYIQAFNAMEKKLKELSNPFKKYENAPRSFFFKKMYEDQLKIEEKDKQLKEAKPVVNYHDTQMRNKGLISTTTIAQKYNLSARKLHQILHDYGIIYKKGKTWHIYKKYQNENYGDYYMAAFNHNKAVSSNLKWTQKGMEMIYNLLKNKGTLPISEQPNLLDDKRKDNK